MNSRQTKIDLKKPLISKNPTMTLLRKNLTVEIVLLTIRASNYGRWGAKCTFCKCLDSFYFPLSEQQNILYVHIRMLAYISPLQIHKPCLVPAAAEEFERRRKNKLFSVFFLLKTDKAVCYIIITVNPKNWRLIRLYLYAGEEEEWADRWNNQFQSTLGAISRHRASQDRFCRKITFVKVCMHMPLVLRRIYIDRLNSVCKLQIFRLFIKSSCFQRSYLHT